VAAAVGDCRLDSQSYRCFRELVVGCDQRGSYAAWSAPRRIFGQCDVFLRPISTIPFSNLTGSKRLRVFDIVVLAGDLLDVGSIVDLRAQSVVVKKIHKQGERKDPTAYLLWES